MNTMQRQVGRSFRFGLRSGLSDVLAAATLGLPFLFAGATPVVGAGPVEVAAPVFAQQVADTIRPIPLAPVEVTVLRTPMSEYASPLAVGVLNERDLRQGRSGVFVEEALQGLPGVQVQNRFNPAVGERVAIRGFGARAQFGLRGIRVLVDGIPATIPDGQSSLDHLDIGSLGRVEVIRGPASALFGNAAGGVLSFHTRAPATEPVVLDVETVGGSHGLLRTQATASGTMDGTGYLFTVSSQSWDGYRPVNPTSARADTLGSYGGAERLGLNARVTRPVVGGELSVTLNVLDLEAENAGSITNDFREDPTWTVEDLYLRFRTLKELSQQQVGMRWDGPINSDWNGDVSLYGVRRSVHNPIPFNVVDLSRDGVGIRGQVGRLAATEVGQFDLQGGMEFDVQNDDRRQLAAPFPLGRPPAGAEPFIDQEERVRNVGVFLQSTLRLPSGAIALAGLRYDHQEFRVDDRFPFTQERPDESGSRTMDAFSPSIGISIPVGAALNAFSSIGSVFETPTTTELKNQPDRIGGINPELDPTRGESFEVGLRGQFQPRATFEVTAYQTNLRNELVPFEVAEQAGVVFWRNAGSSRHRGLEANLSLADATGMVYGNLTYTYTDARFQEYLLGGEDLGGNRVPGVSPQRAQGLVRFGPDAWFAQVVGTYVDNVPVNDANTASAPAYFLVDLRAGFNALGVGNVRLSPWAAITNVMDESYVGSAAVNATGQRYYEPGPGRSFQLGVGAAWGGG